MDKIIIGKSVLFTIHNLDILLIILHYRSRKLKLEQER